MKLKGQLMSMIAAAVLVVTVATTTPTYADDADHAMADRPQHCLSLIRIKDSTILDNQHIVFETVGNKFYLNRLPHPCPGLSQQKAFMYRTSLDELCDLDIITVLDDFGFGFQPGASCGLSVFEPISKQQIEDLKASLALNK